MPFKRKLTKSKRLSGKNRKPLRQDGPQYAVPSWSPNGCGYSTASSARRALGFNTDSRWLDIESSGIEWRKLNGRT